MTQPYKPIGWYRWRNEIIHNQTATMTVTKIAAYWDMSFTRVRYIIDREIEKRAR